METLKLMRQTPCVYTCDGDKGEFINIEIDLPGVNKEDIVFKVTENSFSVKGQAEDVEYAGTFTICCPVVPEKAVAKHTNNMLIVTIPYRELHKEFDLKID